MKVHKPPFILKEIKIEVSHDCELECLHCSSIAGQKTGRSLSWKDCKRILDEAASMGVKEVAFSGGEPLLWKHIENAVKLASKHGMEVFLYSSGNAPNAKNLLEHLHNFGLSKVMFSIFGANELEHEKVTGKIGSYNRTIDAARHCVASGLETEFHFVPLADNFRALKQVVDKAKEIGIKRVSVLRLVPQGRGSLHKSKQLSRTQNFELIRIINDLRSAGHVIRLGSPYNFLMLSDRPACCSGIDRLIIGPDLRIFPCDAFKHIDPKDLGVSSDFSNLKNKSLAVCWEKSAFLEFVRKYLTTEFAEECKDCIKLESCLSGCMAQKYYATGVMAKCADPMCLKRK